MVDENRLEGLRDADKKAAIQDSYNRDGLTASMYTRENWNSLDDSTRFDHEKYAKAAREESLRKIVPNEGDYLPGMTSREMYPVTQRNENVSNQLIEHVNKLSRISERRPPTEYTAVIRPGLTNQSRKVSLFHIPSNDVVGDVGWNKTTGRVEWLGVDYGHRHMTNYLTTQAWNYARSKGELGPATSDDLSPSSAKIMAKYNPNSADFRRHQGIAQEAAECLTCGGTGLGTMRPTSLDGGRTVQYHYMDGSGRVNTPEAPNTSAGVGVGVSSALMAEPGARTMGHFDDNNAILHPDSGNSHYWPDISHFCRDCGGTGERQLHQ